MDHMDPYVSTYKLLYNKFIQFLISKHIHQHSIWQVFLFVASLPLVFILPKREFVYYSFLAM